MVWAFESVLSLATSSPLFRFVSEPFLEGGSSAGELATVEDSEVDVAGRMSCGWAVCDGLSSEEATSIVGRSAEHDAGDDERECFGRGCEQL